MRSSFRLGRRDSPIPAWNVLLAVGAGDVKIGRHWDSVIPCCDYPRTTVDGYTDALYATCRARKAVHILPAIFRHDLTP
jgi:hypothetical protein